MLTAGGAAGRRGPWHLPRRFLEFFVGSDVWGEVAARHGRASIFVDNNPEAVAVMTQQCRQTAPTRGTPPRFF